MCASKYKACIVVNFCFLVWQQRSNIFAPPDGELTCVVCEADRAASLAEPASKPLAIIVAVRGRKKQIKRNILRNWFCLHKCVQLIRAVFTGWR